MAEASNAKLTDFIINKADEGKDTNQNKLATNVPTEKTAEKHNYEETNPTYAICKVCNKPEEDSIHYQHDEMRTISPQDQLFAQPTMNRPSIEVSDTIYDDNPETDTVFTPPEFLPHTPTKAIESDTPTYSYENVKETLQPKVEELDLVKAMNAVEEIVNSPNLGPENVAIAESLLNEIENLIEETKS